MKKIQKFLCVLLCVCTIVSCACVFSFATEEKNTVEVTVSTDKSSYSAIGTATVTLTVENTSLETLDNLNVATSFNETSPIGNDNPYLIGVKLKPGEKCTFSYKTTISSEKLNFLWRLILSIKRIFNTTPRTVETKNIISLADSNLVLEFGKITVSEKIYVWCAESMDVYLTPRNKAEAIENENRRHDNKITEIENNYEFSLELLKVREDAIKSTYGTSSFLSESYYQEKINDLNSEIIELERRIHALSYDNSASSVKKRLEYEAEKKELVEDRERYIELRTGAAMVEMLENEKNIAKANRDKAIANEDDLHKNNLAEIERTY